MTKIICNFKFEKLSNDEDDNFCFFRGEDGICKRSIVTIDTEECVAICCHYHESILKKDS